MNQRVVHFTVPGVPIAQPRPRVTRNGTYVPKSHAIHGYRRDVMLAYTKLGGVYGATFEAAVSIGITFWFPRPKRLAMLAEVIPKTTRPDLDNLAKGVLDSLQNYAFGDDSNVVELRLSKWYVRDGTLARTEISIRDAGGVADD